MSRRLVLALGRHAATEAGGAGASPGTRFLFASLEEALRRHVTVLLIPPYFYTGTGRQALRVAIDVLQQADACVFGLPPSPSDLDPFFLARDRLQTATPFIYMPLGEFPRGAWFYRHLHGRLGPRDLVLFSSYADAAVYEALVATSPAQRAVIPFGIQTSMFRPDGRLREMTRRHLGLGGSDVVFVYHGRITAEKNVHAVLDLARRLARDHERMRLWIIGAMPTSGPLASLLYALLRDDRLAIRTTLWGSMAPEGLPRLLGAADIAITMTLNGDENFGYGAVEAMACGLPVVGTDWGGLKDTIEHAVTGFRVPTRITPVGVVLDAGSAWRYARALLEGEDRRRRMGAAARQSAVRRFGLDRFAAEVAAAVERLVVTPGGDTTPHAWTKLGRNLVGAFGGGNAARPVPAGPGLLREHALMREMLAPYASPRLVQEETLVLATEFLRLRRCNVRSTDPRYPLELDRLSETERAVIIHLRRHQRADLVRLEREAADPMAIGDAVERLRRAGVVAEFALARDELAATT
jgi:glycosyltransferase involved in cell wall biosynthesis